MLRAAGRPAIARDGTRATPTTAPRGHDGRRRRPGSTEPPVAPAANALHIGDAVPAHRRPGRAEGDARQRRASALKSASRSARRISSWTARPAVFITSARPMSHGVSPTTPTTSVVGPRPLSRPERPEPPNGARGCQQAGPQNEPPHPIPATVAHAGRRLPGRHRGWLDTLGITDTDGAWQRAILRSTLGVFPR